MKDCQTQNFEMTDWSDDGNLPFSTPSRDSHPRDFSTGGRTLSLGAERGQPPPAQPSDTTILSFALEMVPCGLGLSVNSRHRHR